jgi:hypothetical protein
MKEYFSHDYNARNDRKLTNLAMIRKMEGIGVYWCILEMMYENDGILPTEYDRIAFELRTDSDLIKSVVNDFELFIVDGNTFCSESVNKRLKIRTDKSDKARENVTKRWDKYKGNTTVIQSNEVRNTIKVKESKEKKKIIEPLIDLGWNDDKPLFQGLLKNYPKLFELKYPLKIEEHQKLIKQYEILPVKQIYMEMQNYKDLLKKSESAYLTACNWLNRKKK